MARRGGLTCGGEGRNGLGSGPPCGPGVGPRRPASGPLAWHESTAGGGHRARSQCPPRSLVRPAGVRVKWWVGSRRRRHRLHLGDEDREQLAEQRSRSGLPLLGLRRWRLGSAGLCEATQAGAAPGFGLELLDRQASATKSPYDLFKLHATTAQRSNDARQVALPGPAPSGLIEAPARGVDPRLRGYLRLRPVAPQAPYSMADVDTLAGLLRSRLHRLPSLPIGRGERRPEGREEGRQRGVHGWFPQPCRAIARSSSRAKSSTRGPSLSQSVSRSPRRDPGAPLSGGAKPWPGRMGTGSRGEDGPRAQARGGVCAASRRRWNRQATSSSSSCVHPRPRTILAKLSRLGLRFPLSYKLQLAPVSPQLWARATCLRAPRRWAIAQPRSTAVTVSSG